MKVCRAHDELLRVRIGLENLGTESLGAWYGGTSAIRLRQIHDTWWWAYKLDDLGHRGTSNLTHAEFEMVRQQVPSATIKASVGRNLEFTMSSEDLQRLESQIVELETKMAKFGDDIAVLFGDFDIRALRRPEIGLFHLIGNRFNGFRPSFHYEALRDDDLPAINRHLPSATLVREGPQTLIEVDDGDIAMLMEMVG